MINYEHRSKYEQKTTLRGVTSVILWVIYKLGEETMMWVMIICLRGLYAKRVHISLWLSLLSEKPRTVAGQRPGGGHIVPHVTNLEQWWPRLSQSDLIWCDHIVHFFHSFIVEPLHCITEREIRWQACSFNCSMTLFVLTVDKKRLSCKGNYQMKCFLNIQMNVCPLALLPRDQWSADQKPNHRNVHSTNYVRLCAEHTNQPTTNTCNFAQ